MSKGVTKLLSDDKIKWLMHVGDNTKETRILLKIWDKEQVASYTLVKPTHDSFGRKGFWSHTILVKLPELTSILLRSLQEVSDKEELEPLEVNP